MTFWEDLKDGLMALTGIKGSTAAMGKIYQSVADPEAYDEISNEDHLQDVTDESIKGKSQLFGVIPNIVGMPLINDVYAAGYGKIVTRRVQSAYKANLMSPMDYIAHSVRYPEKELDFSHYIEESGYDALHEEIMQDLYKYYPNAAEFVRFGVREVFKPAIVAKYGYDNEFPTDIIPHMAKAGLTEEVMKWYWRSHWEMPSFYNIRESLWRGHITDTEVNEWLAINDYAPYWRDKMVKIMYTPYTRVDVRRMYDCGVLDRAAVKRSYNDIGYDDEKAEALTKFTVINADKTKETVATFTKAFGQNLITEEEYKETLERMEYSPAEVELRVMMSNTAEAVSKPMKSITLTTVKALHKRGLIDAYELEEYLVKLNYDEDAVQKMKLLIISDSEPHKRFTAEIKKGYEKDILTVDQTIADLRELGYTDEAISLSIALIDLKKEEDE